MRYYMTMAEARIYQRKDGSRPFDERFEKLEARAAARIVATIAKLEGGLRPDIEPVGDGASEAKIDYGPGYRVYFGLDGQELIVLLLCGNKKRQQADIDEVKVYWAEYKARKALKTADRGDLLKPLEEETDDAVDP
jgi:putative addiction module killer protein